MTENQVRVQVASGDELDVRSFSVKQRMSQLFRVELRVVSSNLSVALDAVIGKEATFSLKTQWSSRSFNGLCIEMEQVRVDREGLATYTLAIAQRMWLLTQRKNYRIFQYKSELDIVRQLLGEWGVTYVSRVARSHKPRKFRVQYDETDFAFVCRMLEDAGIAFYFEQSADGTTLVLDDEPQSREVAHPQLQFHDSPGVTDGNFVTRLSVIQAVRPGAMTVGDLDYRRSSRNQPRLSATGGLPAESPLEQFDYEPGAFLFQGGGGGNTPTADDRGASRTDEGAGGEKTQNRLLARRQGDKRIRLESNVVELAPGSILSVVGHPHRVSASPLLVTGAGMDGEHDGEWRVHVEAVSGETPYRPAQTTPKPRVPGLESATVVGPSGDDIHTDEYARVRVHFHWDRESKRNETSSCWLPTSQPWAGTKFGGVNLPRIGQEVLVEFLGGDPDRPVVIGRVYTETNPPPDKLPKFKEVSGIMSESTPRLVMGAADGGVPGGVDSPLGGGTPMSPGEISSEVSAEGSPFRAQSPTGTMHNWQGSGIKLHDANGEQNVYIQAQKDLNIVVNNCWRTIVANNRGTKIGTDDQLTVQNIHDTIVQKDQKVTVKGKQTTRVIRRRAEKVIGNLELEVGAPGFHLESTEDVINYQATKGLLVEAKNKIELRVNSSHIIIKSGEIAINSGDRVVCQSKAGGGK